MSTVGLTSEEVVNIDQLVEYAKTLPHVVVARQYKFYCSDNGQSEIAKDIRDGTVNRVVVAACSPRMHEPTFRRVLVSAGLNPFYFVQANIREHATWVNMNDPKGAQRIAKDAHSNGSRQSSKIKSIRTSESKSKTFHIDYRSWGCWD